ncbi:hypothetical protein D9M69_521090 [compost metagenome]
MLLKLLHEKLPEIERIGIEAEERGKKLGIKPSWSKAKPKTTASHLIREAKPAIPATTGKLASR